METNQSTGEESRLSQRGQDFQLTQKTQSTAASERLIHDSCSGGRRQSAPALPEDYRTDDAPDALTPDRQSTFEPHRSADSPVHDVKPDNTVVSSHSDEPVMRSSAPDSAFASRGQESKPDRQHGTRYQQQFQPEQWEDVPHPLDAERSGVPSTDSDQAALHTHTPPQEPRPTTRPTHPAADSHSHALDSKAADGVPDTSRIGERPGRLRHDKSGEAPLKGTKPNQRSTKYAQKFTEDTVSDAAGGASAADTSVTPSPDKPTRGTSDKPSGAPNGAKPRLQFGKDEVAPDKKLEKSRLKAKRTSEKLADAKKKLPTRRRPKIDKTVNPKTGKAKRKLHFEEQVKSKRSHVKGPVPLRPVKLGANTAIGYAHKKVFQVERENVSVEAAHKGELMAEGVARHAYRMHKTAPYRRVAKLERLNRKHTVNHMYRQALHDNPKLQSNMLSRFAQKQKIKRQYAKAAREAKRGAKNAKKAGEATAKIAQAIAGFIRRHPAAVGITLLILLLVFVIMTMFGSCSNMGTVLLSSVVSSSYVAEDNDIDDAELAYTEWEVDLLLEIQNAESTHSGYDEYRYNVGDVSHDPYELMAYLTAKYQDFSFAEVQAELRSIFGEQYQLSFVEEVEIHTRTVTRTDPDTGESYEEEEEYEWYVLNINLTSRSFSDVVLPRMNDDECEIFDVLMQTKGNRQYALNPFEFNWLPYVSDFYGWRIHPVSGDKDNHLGIDIAAPAGTQILATHDGRVTFAGESGGYGLVVVIEDDKELVTKYAHCSSLSVSAGQEVKKGDPIAAVGSTGNSTGPHLHFEVLQNGRHLNPLYFSETGDDGSGRIPPGSPGGVAYPEYPGEPLGDGSYAALIAEAEKHLGKKYVFGASGPANFDCSGFVCWTLDKSGVKPMGRTNAQGLYNMSTPVSPENAKPGDLIFFSGYGQKGVMSRRP